jgi:(4-(4-[2-(gamma-L-glutamylamino)ethyl]phenoxymethyl)furan-2-yl)methanamine synthase
MTTTILGLDIGGANLKAATPDKRAVSVPFALWKQPDKLPAALAELVAQFPDAEELAVTMTGELCDCFETKRDGVNAIIKAVRFASSARPIRVWCTDGAFLNSEEAKQHHLKVAAANWHALATYAGRFVPEYGAVLLDIGSTTTDIVPLVFGTPVTQGKTDSERLAFGELVYAGVRRTPICAVYHNRVCAELFATTQDVYVALGLIPEAPDDCNTADSRPLTRINSLARLARMLGGDRELLSDDAVIDFAKRVHRSLVEEIGCGLRNACVIRGELVDLKTVIISGAGEFLAKEVITRVPREVTLDRIISLNDELGPEVSACAPAYAVAVLAAERRP